MSAHFVARGFRQASRRVAAQLLRVRRHCSCRPELLLQIPHRRHPADEDAATYDLSAVRVMLNGAEADRPGTRQGFAEHFAAGGLAPQAMTPCYGLAEATLGVTHRSSPATSPASTGWTAMAQARPARRDRRSRRRRRPRALSIAARLSRHRGQDHQGRPRPSRTRRRRNRDSGRTGDAWLLPGAGAVRRPGWLVPDRRSRVSRRLLSVRDRSQRRRC